MTHHNVLLTSGMQALARTQQSGSGEMSALAKMKATRRGAGQPFSVEHLLTITSAGQ